MKKIKKKYVVGFIVGLLTVLTMEFLMNTEKYVNAFNEGYNKAHQSEKSQN
ncbi:hypothetical protein QYS49_02565 [Marivirga salinae]|uniref:Uncharacterized protein n=1 Tax=Marivirga salinarum TaxID=3059078 RepID=A0AA49GCK9_9BACT|nr:hypothetical protein [Marivirga sp. BDSF4-3]WKK76274.1 hypothetical protein QYS49_02565 [Marivirga sp. BDSF4-3]